jgi:hypothetical protein
MSLLSKSYNPTVLSQTDYTRTAPTWGLAHFSNEMTVSTFFPKSLTSNNPWVTLCIKQVLNKHLYNCSNKYLFSFSLLITGDSNLHLSKYMPIWTFRFWIQPGFSNSEEKSLLNYKDFALWYKIIQVYLKASCFVSGNGTTGPERSIMAFPLTIQY